MCKIENKRIILVDFYLMFKGEWRGTAVCTYDYNSARDGFTDLLKIDLNIMDYLNKGPVKYEYIEREIMCFENSSQAFDLINNFLKIDYFGTDIVIAKTIYEFNYISNPGTKIIMALNGPKLTPYEIFNRLDEKKYMSLTDKTEEDAINLAYMNLI